VKNGLSIAVTTPESSARDWDGLAAGAGVPAGAGAGARATDRGCEAHAPANSPAAIATVGARSTRGIGMVEEETDGGESGYRLVIALIGSAPPSVGGRE
jgi:hypothetical protein